MAQPYHLCHLAGGAATLFPQLPQRLLDGPGARVLEVQRPESGETTSPSQNLPVLSGAKPGEAPDFTPRPNEFKVDPATGLVKDSHGVSVFDNPESVSNKGFVPHEVNQATIPESLRIIQRGKDPAHFEITPRPGANLTPDDFVHACRGIKCQ